MLREARPDVTFLCSPNNPTGRADRPEEVAEVTAQAPGLVVVDEAYGQFAPTSALDLAAGRRDRRRPARRRAHLLEDVVDGGRPPRLPRRPGRGGGRPASS